MMMLPNRGVFFESWRRIYSPRNRSLSIDSRSRFLKWAWFFYLPYLLLGMFIVLSYGVSFRLLGATQNSAFLSVIDMVLLFGLPAYYLVTAHFKSLEKGQNSFLAEFLSNHAKSQLVVPKDNPRLVYRIVSEDALRASVDVALLVDQKNRFLEADQVYSGVDPECFLPFDRNAFVKRFLEKPSAFSSLKGIFTKDKGLGLRPKVSPSPIHKN